MVIERGMPMIVARKSSAERQPIVLLYTYSAGRSSDLTEKAA
jgi:hypothetical protein